MESLNDQAINCITFLGFWGGGVLALPSQILFIFRRTDINTTYFAPLNNQPKGLATSGI